MIINNLRNVTNWVGDVDPDNDVHNWLNAYPQIGDFYTNTETTTIFICYQEGVENQLWYEFFTKPEV
jgi:hypothetical protein